MDLQDRYRSVLLKFATRDVLGTTLEFTYPIEFEPIEDMIGSDPFGRELYT